MGENTHKHMDSMHTLHRKTGFEPGPSRCQARALTANPPSMYGRITVNLLYEIKIKVWIIKSHFYCFYSLKNSRQVQILTKGFTGKDKKGGKLQPQDSKETPDKKTATLNSLI